jgi:hypothetical protein
MEMIYELMTFGIPTQVVPWSLELNMSFGYQEEWIEKRKKLESSLDEANGECRAVIPG